MGCSWVGASLAFVLTAGCVVVSCGSDDSSTGDGGAGDGGADGGPADARADVGPNDAGADVGPADAGCKANTDCPMGAVCNTADGSCTATCKCTTDADAVKQGAGFCDEARGTCMAGTDPNGSCVGAVGQTCTMVRPTCGEGQVATIVNGCYSGLCESLSACSATPACGSLQHEDDCAARTDCSTILVGHGCTKPDGSACRAGDTNCTCTSFTFQGCEHKAAAAGSNRIIFGD